MQRERVASHEYRYGFRPDRLLRGDRVDCLGGLVMARLDVLTVRVNGCPLPRWVGWRIAPNGVVQFTWAGYAVGWLTRAVPWIQYAAALWRGEVARRPDGLMSITVEFNWLPDSPSIVPAVFRRRRA